MPLAVAVAVFAPMPLAAAAAATGCAHMLVAVLVSVTTADVVRLPVSVTGVAALEVTPEAAL
ncbi:hypothetical protein [Nonomuraea sp. B19D2]|uniref:hypothetical protein n=1 Tax=Nonomuraea sp. B19D2 TaxID=3159561 RepID=UPI0032DB4EA1